MKKQMAVFTLAVLSYCCLGAVKEYEFTFGNRIPGLIDAPFYGIEFLEPPNLPDYANAKWGNTTNGLPPGNQVYKGALLEGYSVMFMAAVGNHTNGRDLFPADVVLTLGSGAEAGYFPTTTVKFALPTPDPSLTFGTFQVRVWDSMGGTKTWDQVAGNYPFASASELFIGKFGEVSTGLRSFSAGFLDPRDLTPYDRWPPYEVPEPGLLALLGMGVLVRLLRRRQSPH